MSPTLIPLQILQAIRASGHNVPPGYSEGVERARLGYKHAWVYDKATKTMVHLNPPPLDDGIDLSILGPQLSSETAQRLAEGARGYIPG